MEYEVGLYNSLVRTEIRINGNDWNNMMGISSEYENVLYFPVRANSKEHVKQLVENEWPSKSGFVIDCIMLVGD